MEPAHDPARLRIGPQGRVVIPAAVRRQLGLEPGETVTVRVEEGRLVLERPANVLRRLRERFARVPAGVSLASELIAERRREAIRESEE